MRWFSNYRNLFYSRLSLALCVRCVWFRTSSQVEVNNIVPAFSGVMAKWQSCSVSGQNRPNPRSEPKAYQVAWLVSRVRRWTDQSPFKNFAALCVCLCLPSRIFGGRWTAPPKHQDRAMGSPSVTIPTACFLGYYHPNTRNSLFRRSSFVRRLYFCICRPSILRSTFRLPQQPPA